MRIKKKYSAAQKFEAAMSVIRGEKSTVETARNLGCHPNLVANWKEAILKEGSVVFEKETAEGEKEARIAKLERLIGKITVENDFLERVLGRSSSR
jgi:transposase-like protein